MAIEWNLLSQGLNEPTPYEQQKSRNMQAQLQQQQLAGAQSQTRASEMQLQQMIESSNRTKKFAQDIAEKGGDPGDWLSVAEALNNTGQVENVIHAQKMVQDFYESDKLANILNNEPPPSFNKWITDKKASRANAAAPQPAAAPAAARVPDITALAAGGNIPTEPVNQLAPKIIETPVNQLAPAVAAANQGLTPVDVIDKPELTEKQKILALAQSNAPNAGRLLTAVSKTYDPSEVLKLENEIAEFKKRGARDTDDVIKNRLQLIENMVSGKDPEYAGYQIAKREGFKGGFIDYKKLDANLKRVREAPAAVTLATIVDPNDPTRTIVVDARTGRQIGEGTKTSPGAELTPKDRQAREAKYPQATLAVKTFESNADRLAKDLEELANHPGLDGMSGTINGRTMVFKGPSKEALDLYNSIVARGGFNELAAMRAASPTGGALGNVSNQEGQYLRDAFAPINRTKDTPDLAKSLIKAAEAVKASASRTREAYDATYEYRAGQTDRPAGSNKGADALPKKNADGWTLHIDKDGNKAYVSPDGKQAKEVK
jgi:hypothetical protein